MEELRELVRILQDRKARYFALKTQHSALIKQMWNDHHAGRDVPLDHIRCENEVRARIEGKYHAVARALGEVRLVAELMEKREETIELSELVEILPVPPCFTEKELEEIHHVNHFRGTYSVVFHGGKQVSADTLEKACNLAADLILLWELRERGIVE